MSVRVLTKAFTCSQAALAARLVLLALADAAHDDGVTWLDQQTLATKANVSEPTVRRALRELEELGEVELRKAQRGRRRINVYRVIIAGLAEVDYDRLPFTLAEPFTTTEQSERSSNGDGRASTHVTTEQSERSLARASEQSLNRKENRKEGTAIAVPPKPRPRNLVYDALAEACGSRPQLLDTTSPIYDKDLARMIGVAQNSIRDKAKGLDDFALAAEVALRAQAYRRKWPDIDLTPTALAKHWNTVIGGTSRLTADEIAKMG